MVCISEFPFPPQYQLLFTFDTETSYTHVVETNPAFIWGKKLPNVTPDRGKHTLLYTDHSLSILSQCSYDHFTLTFSGPALQDIIVTVLAVAVVIVATIAFIFYR